MKKYFIYLLLSLLITSCGEHKGHTIKTFTGDYRFNGGIAEFFDCEEGIKYYIAKSGAYKELQDKYSSLNMKDEDDIYVKVEGYVKEEELMDGIGFSEVFVFTKLLSIDQDRGCKRAIRAGH